MLRAIEADHSTIAVLVTMNTKGGSGRVLAGLERTVMPGCCRAMAEGGKKMLVGRFINEEISSVIGLGGIRGGQPREIRIYVSDNVRLKGSNGCGQAISAVHSFPEVMVKRKLCSLTIAATRLKPSPSPPLLRLLSER